MPESVRYIVTITKQVTVQDSRGVLDAIQEAERKIQETPHAVSVVTTQVNVQRS